MDEGENIATTEMSTSGLDAAIAAAMKEVGGNTEQESEVATTENTEKETDTTESTEEKATEDNIADDDSDDEKNEEETDEDDSDDEKNEEETDEDDDDGDSKKKDIDAKGKLKAPVRWDKKWKENFDKLPVDAQKLVLEQSREWTKGLSAKAKEAADSKKALDRFVAAVPENVRKGLNDNQIPVEAAVTRLFERWLLSENDPTKFISDFLVQKKIDPAIFITKAGEEGKDPVPAVHEQLAPILEPLIRKITRLEESQNATTSRQQAYDDDAIQKAILSVAEAKDSDGNLLYPYLEDVEAEMVSILNVGGERYAQLGPRERLIEAYNSAVYMNPDVRTEIISAEAAKTAEAMERSKLKNRIGDAATTKPKPSGQMMTSKTPTSGFDAAFNAALKEVGGKR